MEQRDPALLLQAQRLVVDVGFTDEQVILKVGDWTHLHRLKERKVID